MVKEEVCVCDECGGPTQNSSGLCDVCVHLMELESIDESDRIDFRARR